MKIGLITIGQSPRVDVVPEMVQILGDVDIIECGALDNLTAEEIQKLAPKEGGLCFSYKIEKWDSSQAK